MSEATTEALNDHSQLGAHLNVLNTSTSNKEILENLMSFSLVNDLVN